MESYSAHDLRHLVEYARRKGIRVIPEIDLPGHSRAWSTIFPDLFLKDHDCPLKSAIDPRSLLEDDGVRFKATIGEVLRVIGDIFPDHHMHIGADEVDIPETKCWSVSAELMNWTEKKYGERSTKRLLKEFITALTSFITEVLGKEEVSAWDESYELGVPPSSKIMFQFWRTWGSMRYGLSDIAKSGRRVIGSPVSHMYLDSPNLPWSKTYLYSFCAGFEEDSAKCDMVIGGEVCAWSELMDDTNLDKILWPRAAGLAENLWTRTRQNHMSSSASNDDISPTVKSRLAWLRCYLMLRIGVGVSNFNSSSDLKGPGSCGSSLDPVDKDEPFKVRSIYGDSIHTRAFLNGLAYV
ncbi:hypothetical protein FOL47_000145 [Perkinsus chesapeaki]|uniref:beta-N-acetylhexosaminidase n=1 Tax=Perkinsus chesapeaki TaxID=330153 RepID=A0A7J6MP39_PERCH|nr:hypothetical protein FOL47_000145 [Perkinsus chesapeaki]